MQAMKGKEGTGDRGGPDAKSGRYSSGSGLCPSGEKRFFADVSESSGRVNIETTTPSHYYQPDWTPEMSGAEFHYPAQMFVLS